MKHNTSRNCISISTPASHLAARLRSIKKSLLCSQFCLNFATHRTPETMTLFCDEHAPAGSVQLEAGYFKTYRAERKAGRVRAYADQFEIELAGEDYPAFDFGHASMGTKRLALAILTDYFLPDAAKAERWHKSFLHHFLAVASENFFEITGVMISLWYDNVQSDVKQRVDNILASEFRPASE